MMKNFLMIVFAICFVSCSSFKAERVGAKESDEKSLEITDNWMSEDTRTAIKEVIKQMETHPRFKRQLKKYRGEPKVFVAEVQNNTIIPDFILTLEDGNLIVEINRRNSPELKLSNYYKEILKGYKDDPNKKKSQNEAIQFIKQKLDSAKWFIEAIEQRQTTLFVTINALIDFQKDYFLTGEEKLLKPMILKDIAKKVDMDISTISRVANSKYIDTPYGIKLLKSYFSEGMKNIEGEDISTIEIKKILKEIIDNENKNKPLADLELSKRLIDAGYKVARRTIAKYREQMGIPVARLRKEL